VRRTLGLVLAGSVLLAGCGRDESSTTTGAAAGNAAKGQQAWLAHCVVCHNADPSKDGPIGPSVKGSSRALLEAKVLRGEYPPRYKPKRETKVMPPRPDLAPSLPDLAAYLQ